MWINKGILCGKSLIQVTKTKYKNMNLKSILIGSIAMMLMLSGCSSSSSESGDVKNDSINEKSKDSTDKESQESIKENKEELVGLFPVYVNGKYGYIDRTGKIVVNPQFDYARDFSDGMAVVGIGDYLSQKYGFIDKTGKIGVNPQFDWVQNVVRQFGPYLSWALDI